MRISGAIKLAKIKENKTQATKRTLKILDCFIGDTKGLTLSLISKQTSLPVSTTSRILNFLVEEDYLFREELSKQYFLGKKIYLLGYLQQSGDFLIKIILPYLHKLMNEFQETVIIHVKVGNKRRLYYKLVPDNYYSFTPEIGTEYSLWAGAGAKAMLAFLNEEERELMISQVHPMTSKTIVDKELLRKEILLVRERGYATSFDEYSLGFSSVSGPVINNKNETLCVIGITVPSVRITAELAEKMGSRIREYCTELSKCFGWAGSFHNK